jgi:hypothetical protein
MKEIYSDILHVPIKKCFDLNFLGFNGQELNY